ncbi:hypothetical protein [Methanobrevibacter arboriphilus]|nr:hypothetical protein [Methanobrevibacter arboriphilus]
MKKIAKSKSVFKAGTKIKIKVYTVSSIKKVQGHVSGKKNFQIQKK